MLKRMLVVAAALAVLVAPVGRRPAATRTSWTPRWPRGASRPSPTALQAAGLVDTLKGTGPFTVFAPTDEAFAKIPKADLDALIADKAKLTKVLTYHVVAGKVMAADVVKLKEAKTVEGQMVKIDTSNGVKINGAKVVKADVEASQRCHPRDRLRAHAAVAARGRRRACRAPGSVAPGADDRGLDVAARTLWRGFDELAVEWSRGVARVMPAKPREDDDGAWLSIGALVAGDRHRGRDAAHLGEPLRLPGAGAQALRPPCLPGRRGRRASAGSPRRSQPRPPRRPGRGRLRGVARDGCSRAAPPRADAVAGLGRAAPRPRTCRASCAS